MKNNNAKYAFLYMFSLVALLFVALGTGQVIFQAINKFITDVALPYNSDFNSDLLKMAISALIISIPVYYLVMRYLSKSLVKGELDKESAIRRWLIYFILFVSSVVMIIWLITVISSFLNGELTTKSILKAVTAMLISGIIFAYYFYDVKRDEIKAKDVVVRIFLIATLVLTIGSLIGSFFFVETPNQARARKHDEQVLSQFTELDGAFNTYYTKYNKLPDNLAAGLSETPYLSADKYKDPSSNKPYEYKKTGNDSYELCADFQTDNKDVKDQATYVYADRWPHGTGYQCIKQKALNFDKQGNGTVPIGNLPADRVQTTN
ncbi:MAG: DUF5671 domain-containing protein [Candidatus Falkowbacteria bacterium]|nr:DUF5671 domain-containing protein [Candidatus Falkowbacteria bacterium]